ncbi:MAG: TrkA C-terminal domain-containing protein [Deltaproteobacteria bacterium]|nr:TrkA C-terminal domain-containing protein [Deltaproteobacteria bacterium]
MIQHSGHGDHHRHVDLQPGFETREIPVRGRLVGKTLATLNLRANFGINCVAVKEGGRESTFEDAVPDPREVLKDGDVLVCIGTKDQLAKLAEGDVEAGLETREIAVGGALTGKTLAGLNMRAEYGLNCVAIKPADPAGGPTTIFPEPGRVLADGDILICSGYDEQFEKFSAAQKY